MGTSRTGRQPMNYYKFQVEQQRCEACGWVGTGEQTERGETYESLFEFHCPACGVKMGICSYPTWKEAEEAWDLVPEADRVQFRVQQALGNIVDATRLKRADELPPIHEPSFTLTWDVEERENFPHNWTVVRLGDRVIWREVALWEDGYRFIEIADILRDRYGNAFVDMEPTRESWDCLYGDCLAMPGIVDRARERLRETAGRKGLRT